MLFSVIGLLVLELLLTTTAVAFTHRNSLIRLALLPVMVAATYKVMIICVSGQIESPIGRAILGSGSVYRIIHYVAIVVIDRWSFEPKGPTSSLGGLTPASEIIGQKRAWSWGELAQRFQFGVRVSTTTRFSTTRWSVRSIPPFHGAKPGEVPPRNEFLLRTIVRVGVLGCCLGLTGTFAQRFWYANADIFAERNVPVFSRLREVTLTELVARPVGVIAYWTMQYLSLSLMYGFLSFLAVAARLSDAEEWPPVFGRFEQTWSIAQFWGCFYHQNIRRGCSSIAHLTTYGCLRLEKGSLLGRYTFITTVFAISGTFHLLSDLARGIPREESKAMQFFLMQPVGMMFERGVQFLYRKSGVSIPMVFARVVGHCWVLFWITWTSPMWIYTSMRPQ